MGKFIKTAAKEIGKTAGLPAPKKKRMNKKRLYDTVCGWIFLSPALLGFVAFTLLPLVLSFYYSFTEYNMLSTPIFIGFRNYTNMFKLASFNTAVKNTMLFATVVVAMNIVLSFAVAYLLNIKLKGMPVFRTIFYLPCIIPGVAGAFIYSNLFDASTGYINQVLKWFGLQPSPFLTDPKTAVFTIIIMGLWGMGGPMLIWLAGFKSVPNSLYEASKLDGARWWQDLFHITIPLCTPMIFYNMVTDVIGGLQTFGSVYLLTNGGPQDSTVTLVMLIYNRGIGYHQMGIASAIAWFLFAITMALTLVLFATKKWVYTEDGR